MAGAQQLAERRIELDEDEPLGVDPLFDQRCRHRTGAGAELDHLAVEVGVDEARHGAGEWLAGGRHRPGRQGLLHPGTQKMHLVVEAQTLFSFGTTQRRLKQRVARHSFVTQWSRL
jgi:hypothetical protein